MSVIDTISRPYAQAIFEIALQDNNIQEWKKMLMFLNTISSSKKIRNFLSGALSPKYLSFVFITISHDIINDQAKNFVKLLAEHQRLRMLNNILKQFLKLELDYLHILIIKLNTAFPFKEKTIIKIQGILENFFLKKVKLLCKVDPQMLGGMIIKIDDTVFDFSVLNHLKQLSIALNFRE